MKRQGRNDGGLRFRLVPLLVAVACVCTTASIASGSGTTHVVEQARSGVLLAELSYFDTPHTQSYVSQGKRTTYTSHTYSAFRFSLLRSGKLLFSRRLSCEGCQPGGLNLTHPARSVHFASLQPGEPAVLVDLYTGGAHCCFESAIILPTPRGVRMIQERWGDPGYRLQDLNHDGSVELVTVDDRFAYTFTDYASSAFPIKILRLKGGSLANVTRSYPAEIKADAAKLFASYLKSRGGQYADARGVLAAWAADEARLGHWATASTKLNQALTRGDLDQPGFTVGPVGRTYLAQLRRFLMKSGYL